MKRLLGAAGLLAIALLSPLAAREYHYQNAQTPHRHYGPESGQHYTNVNGDWVHSPERALSRPVGATARCADGTWSYSQHRRGTCSHHGGVASW